MDPYSSGGTGEYSGGPSPSWRDELHMSPGQGVSSHNEETETSFINIGASRIPVAEEHYVRSAEIPPDYDAEELEVPHGIRMASASRSVPETDYDASSRITDEDEAYDNNIVDGAHGNTIVITNPGRTTRRYFAAEGRRKRLGVSFLFDGFAGEEQTLRRRSTIGGHAVRRRSTFHGRTNQAYDPDSTEALNQGEPDDQMVADVLIALDTALDNTDGTGQLRKQGDILLPTDYRRRRASRLNQLESSAPLSQLESSRRSTINQLDITRLAQDLNRSRAANESGKAKMRIRAVKDFFKDFQLWDHTLKNIEGHFGSGVSAYFDFIKWLILLNMALVIVMVPIFGPQISFYGSTKFGNNLGNACPDNVVNTPVPAKGYYQNVSGPINCSWVYDCYTDEAASRWNGNLSWSTVQVVVLDIIQGTGYLEKFPIFYGAYFHLNKTNSEDAGILAYPMTSIYLPLVTLLLLLSFLLMLSSISSYLKTSIASGSKLGYAFSAAVFGSWDHGLTFPKAVKLQKAQLRKDLEGLLIRGKREKLRQDRTSSQKAQLYGLRIFINLVCLGTLGACGVAIFVLSDNSQKWLLDENKKPAPSAILVLFFEYVPSITITVMYFIVPVFFGMIVKLEKYSEEVEVNLTVSRVLLLRLASLLLLFIQFFNANIEGDYLTSCKEKFCGNCESLCWETNIGQQVYKLVLLDLAVGILVVVLVEFPRGFLARRASNESFLMRNGLLTQEFSIPKYVMDVVYSQTLCWFGALFSPIIPLITLFKIFVYFYLRKWSLFKNQKPPTQLSKASSISFFFVTVLMFSFLLVFFVFAIFVSVMPASQSCGPYRNYSDAEADEGSVTMLGITIRDILVENPNFDEFVSVVSDYAQWNLVSVFVFAFLVIYTYYNITTTLGANKSIQGELSQLSSILGKKQLLLSTVHKEIQMHQDERMQHRQHRPRDMPETDEVFLI